MSQWHSRLKHGLHSKFNCNTSALSDSGGVNCSDIRQAISCRLDGEPAPLGSERIDEHLATCEECRSFDRGALRLHRAVRLRPADHVPDLTGLVLVWALAGFPLPRIDRSVLRFAA